MWPLINRSGTPALKQVGPDIIPNNSCKAKKRPPHRVKKSVRVTSIYKMMLMRKTSMFQLWKRFFGKMYLLLFLWREGCLSYHPCLPKDIVGQTTFFSEEQNGITSHPTCLNDGVPGLLMSGHIFLSCFWFIIVATVTESTEMQHMFLCI